VTAALPASATVATIAVGVGVAAVGAAIALFVLAPSPPSSPRAALRIAPAIGLRDAGLSVEGLW
jgi:hypothetical protein